MACGIQEFESLALEWGEYGFIAFDRRVSAGAMPANLYEYGLECIPNDFGVDINFFGLVVAGDPPPQPAGDPRDRLRSTASEDLGSLLDAVEAIPVDLGFDVAFTNAVSQEPAVLMAYRELTRATDSPTVDLVVYPRPQQNTVMEEQFSGVTVLSRLANWYPPLRMFGTTTDFGLPLPAPASAVIEYVLSQWATLQPWLTYKPVPDLRLPAGLPPNEYGPDTGLVTTETLTLRQDGEHRENALSILRNLLSPFPGTIVRQDSDGDLIIVPRYGPDADNDPIVTLRPNDLYTVSAGKPDPFTTVNRARFTAAGGLERAEDVPLMEPAWFQIGSPFQLGRDTWFEPPGDRTNLQPPTGEDTTLQEGLTFEQFGRQRPNLWRLAGDRIPAGDGIRLYDEHVDPLITVAWRRYHNNNLEDSGTDGTFTQWTRTIGFNGQWGPLFTWQRPTGNIGGEVIRVVVEARWNESEQGIEFRLPDRQQLQSNCWATGCRGWVVEFTLNDRSVGYTEAATNTGEFGFEATDSLPGANGSNALLESQDAFGILERTISVRGYALSGAQLAAAARGFVLANITPRVTRELELALGAQGVTFDTVGRLIELPSGEVGVLNGLTYSDEFTTGAWSKTARVQLLDGSAPGAVPSNPFAGAITLTSGVVLTDTSGALITVTGA